jgi:Protein of unknown function (DUF2491)
LQEKIDVILLRRIKVFGRLFGRAEAPQGPTLPVIRNLTIGRSLRVDPLAWRRFGSAARFGLETDSLDITAQGLINLGADGFVHRFYTDDDLMFQVVSPDREGVRAQDFTLFMPWVSAWPPNPAARRVWLDRMRAPQFTADGLDEYQRFWFEPESPVQDPVSFWEDVYDDREAKSARRIYQTCMLFARELPGEGRELLLTIEMEPQGGDITHEVMIGIPLDIAEFQA